MTKQVSLVQSSCAYCGVGCGVDISLENQHPVAITGTPEHPANYGRLCVKGSKLLETLSPNTRLLAPEVNGERATWQQAIDHVATQLNDTIAKWGKDSVAFYVSGQLLTEDYYLANKLMKGYIGSGNIDTNSRLCMSSAVSAYKRSFGEDVVPCDYQDIELTELLLVVGSNLAWTHPVLYQRIEKAKRINSELKVVVIDPRKTASSELADEFLPIKAGTDAAFFNGLLNYLHENNGLNHDYIQAHTEGFNETLAQTKCWSLAKVSQFCQVDIKQLEGVYQLFCQAERAVTFYSMGINQSSSGVDKCHSIINCHLGSGKIAKLGCGPFSITGQPNAMGGREVGGLANQLTAHLDIENPAHREHLQHFWQSPTMVTQAGKKAVDMFEDIRTGKIKAVWIMATNPLVSLPNRKLIEEALTNCPLVIVSDCVENNDTLAYANVKLAATPWLEKNGTVTNSERRISRQRSVIQPSGEAKHDWQIIANVAQRMGFNGFNYQGAHQVFDEFARLTAVNAQTKRVFDISGLCGLSLAEYDQLKPIQWPVPSDGAPKQRVFNDGQFATTNGRAKFFPVIPALPIQSISSQYQLQLNSGRLRDHWHSMTRTGNSASLSLHTEQACLYIHSEDLRNRGLSDGQLVEVNSATGQVIVPVKSDNSLRVGECFLPLHWNKQFASHANVSALYNGVVDPISGQPESKQTAISVKASNMTYFAECHIRQNNINTTIFKGDFWTKNTTEYGSHYRLAFSSAISDKLLWCQQQVKLANTNNNIDNGEWLTFGDNSAQYIICLQQKQLIFVGSFGAKWSDTEPAWLTHVFNKEQLAFSDIQALLIGQATSEFAKGKQICSCFAVGEKDIVSAITQGCTSVTALGKKLKCGTKCGSCKPELAQLIDSHCESIDKKQESHIEITHSVVTL